MSTPAYDTVRLARANKRPTGLDYINNLCADFFELHGDRRFADDGAIVGGVGHFRGLPVTFLAIEKGHSAKERMARSFGAPHPEGYRKALRLMKQAEKFHRPVLCFVDTSGANCGIGAEERGQGQAIAENLMTMMSLDTPVITVLIGEGGSGGALAIGVSDKTLMLENSIFSILSPEGFASILWKDASRWEEAAEVMKLTAEDLQQLGICDVIIPEGDGAHKDANLVFAAVERELSETLQHLMKEKGSTLAEQRYRKIRNIGRKTWQ